MGASYKKLWKLLIDIDMKKQDLCVKAGVSATSLAKLGRGYFVQSPRRKRFGRLSMNLPAAELRGINVSKNK